MNFFDAVENADIGAIKNLLRVSDPNIKNREGMTPLTLACYHSFMSSSSTTQSSIYEKIIKLLLDNGAVYTNEDLERCEELSKLNLQQIKNLKLKEKLGSGTYGTVYKTEDGRAIKKMSCPKDIDSSTLF